MAVAKTMGVIILVLIALWIIFALVGVVAALLKSIFVVLIVLAACYGDRTTTSSTRRARSRLATSGGVAERLGRGLRKPRTPVRIRTPPPERAYDDIGVRGS